MTRRVFYSFHYQPDSQRASQVRQMNSFESQDVLPSNDWEEVKKAGDSAVYRWIDDQMQYKSCVIVLIGAGTANRKYINYEIRQAWSKGKELLGVDISGLKNLNGQTSSQGANPFDYVTADGISLTGHGIPRYTHPFNNSQLNYGHIRDNLSRWVEAAVIVASLR